MRDVVKPTLTPAEACVVLGINKRTLQALVHGGLLQEDRVGDLVRFEHEEIARFIETMTLEREGA